jgi:pyruvate kinase
MLSDLRGKRRRLAVRGVQAGGVWAEAADTAYVGPGTELRLSRGSAQGRPSAKTDSVGMLPALSEPLLLRPGDTLVLTADPAEATAGTRDEEGRLVAPHRVSCSLPEVLADLRPGEPIWFDDGKFGGRIVSADAREALVEIVHARPEGGKLGPDKGINLPDTALHLAGLTQDDVRDLDFVCRHADLVALSFVREANDVRLLQDQLRARRASHLGLVLKIETRQAFAHLPDILLAAMRSHPIGVMIARGDLAVESGWERLAEIQEEILWLCEAAHVPVIWATQVLESLNKTGLPSRAEITDAAMSERAECVMLNKGPYAVRAVHVLDDILRRMQRHQEKKIALLRPLSVAGRLDGAVGDDMEEPS